MRVLASFEHAPKWIDRTPQIDREKEIADIIEPNLPICDAHFHLMDHLDIRYLAPDYARDAGDGHRVVSSVHIEARGFYRASGPEHLRSVGEVEFISGIRRDASDLGGWVCQGIVGYVDLAKPALAAEALDHAIEAGGGAFKGVRQGAYDPGVYGSRPNAYGRGLYAREDFRQGMLELIKRGLSLDAWQFFFDLSFTVDLARALPEAAIVVNHLGGLIGVGPWSGRRDEAFQVWCARIRDLSRCPNVMIKLGGMGRPQAGFDFSGRGKNPSSEDMASAWRPYFEIAIEAFGPSRCMFESNFPIDRVSCSYRNVWNAFKRIVARASPDEKAALFHGSASRFYRLGAPGISD